MTPKKIANFMINDAQAVLNKHKLKWAMRPVSPDDLIAILAMKEAGYLTKGEAKDLFEACVLKGME